MRLVEWMKSCRLKYFMMFSGVSRACHSPRQRALVEGFCSESHEAPGLQSYRKETEVLGFVSIQEGGCMSVCAGDRLQLLAVILPQATDGGVVS